MPGVMNKKRSLFVFLSLLVSISSQAFIIDEKKFDYPIKIRQLERGKVQSFIKFMSSREIQNNPIILKNDIAKISQYKNDTIIAKPRRLSDPMSEIVISTPKCHFLYLSSLPESEKVPYPDF